MCSAAEDLCLVDGVGGPLFELLYPGMCLDDGALGTGDQDHRLALLQDLPQSEAFTAKGDKVSLKRWFQWFPAALRFDRTWHRRLLALLYIGLKTRAYKDFQATPLYTAHHPSATAPQDPQAGGGGQEKEEEEEEEQEEARKQAKK
eukprot:5079391-Lingulodinium_polyedra.AAC.1